MTTYGLRWFGIARRCACLLLAAASLAMSAAVLTTAAFGGQYDYWLLSSTQALDPNTWGTRNQPHDYSYLSGTAANNITSCVRRSNGLAFCANWTATHSYSDSCNPSSCISYYQFYPGPSRLYNVHDEWR